MQEGEQRPEGQGGHREGPGELWELEEIVSKLFEEIRDVGGTWEIEIENAIMNKMRPDLTSDIVTTLMGARD